MARPLRTPLVASSIAVSLLAGAVRAQIFQNAPNQLPALNVGFTENVDFADIDGDGDRDCVKAEGGDAGNQFNRMWLNKGGLQGGTPGIFQDVSIARFPLVLDASRDVDFVDLDLDGDPDLYISETSAAASQSNRFWINMGGAQGGTAGFFQDQSASRWTFIAVNDGVTHDSSIAPSVKLASGGFIDWSCDCVFGDLDDDGDPDLFHSTYGGVFGGHVPSRIFLNNGAGFFEEFNPTFVQLSGSDIPNGTPALWCEGVQQHTTTDTTGAQADIADTPLGVELGDLDGDLDLDVLQGARNETPRLYRNRLTDVGAFVRFRDVTFASFAQFADNIGNYEQELGDFDNDDDLDLYGLNWPNGLWDCTAQNDGAGHFGAFTVLANSGSDDNEPDWFDADCDGDLDVYVTDFGGQDRLYRNGGATSGWSFSDDTAASLAPEILVGLGSDTCDVDLDGDYDVMVGNDQNEPELLLINGSNVPDTNAPRLAHLEQAPDRSAGPAPTVVRVHVYDNSSWDVMRYDALQLEYSWNGGVAWHLSPMRYSGGQLFRGEIRGDLAGTISYRVRARDEHGNVGQSATKSYLASGCTGNVFTYCTGGTTSSGCVASMGASGTPSLSAASGFVLTASHLEGGKSGLIFYGTSGAIETPWGQGFLCVKAPTQRTTPSASGGSAGQCDGSIALDWLAYLASHPAAPLSAGQAVDVQCWFRDPPSAKTTQLSDALEFLTCP